MKDGLECGNKVVHVINPGERCEHLHRLTAAGIDTNAVEQSGQLELRDDHVRLSVQDAGVGFGPEGAERLFEAFYTTKSDGMGIGLSVSRSIVEKHNGHCGRKRTMALA